MIASRPIDQTDRSDANTSPGSKVPIGVDVELADLVIGSYVGDVIAGSKGGSRSDIGLTITQTQSIQDSCDL